VEPGFKGVIKTVIATLMIVLLAVVALAACVLIGVRYFVGLDAESELLAVDMESLAALIDDGQTEYLKGALTPRQFRLYEREQSLVIAGYVRRINHNSRLVIARASGVHTADASAQSQRVEMLNLAMQTRALCFSALMRLYLNAYIPWAKSPLQQVASIHNSASRFIPRLADSTIRLTLHTRT
jgi:hypothetical protein